MEKNKRFFLLIILNIIQTILRILYKCEDCKFYEFCSDKHICNDFMIKEQNNGNKGTED